MQNHRGNFLPRTAGGRWFHFNIYVKMKEPDLKAQFVSFSDSK